MTDEHDHDADLAPVTDLFGARSRRGRSASPAGRPDGHPRAGAPAGADERWYEPDPDPDPAPRSDPEHEGGVGAGAESDAASTGAADADAPVPLHGARPQAEWLSPVVGDGSGRSARAEQTGYDAQRGYDTETADAATASVFSIRGGQELEPDEVPRPLDEQRADAERVSMRALGRKGVSESEMRQVLTKQDLDPDVVEHEIARLLRVGLLDDVALATDLVDRLHERKGLGRQGVVAELRRRGIDQTAIDAALEAAADDADDEFVRAIELAQKRAGQLRGLDRATAERRLSGFLMRKGYSSGVVRIAVERALDGGGRRPPSGGGSVRFE